MCEVLRVSRAGFYRWRHRPPSKQSESNSALLDFLMTVANAEHRIPGYRKLWRAATDHGYRCSQNRVQRLLQSMGYRSCTARKPGYRRPKPSMPQMPNLLNRNFTAAAKNQIWTSDITQVRCAEGWLYIAVVLDLHSRAVVGWATSAINSSDMVVSALSLAWSSRSPNGSKLLFHSDQGSQYRSEKVARWLSSRGVTISMSRKGECWDNACTESFFAQMKKEWFKRLGIRSRTETHYETEQYVQSYYNPVRRHGTLGGLSPMAFEARSTPCLL